MPTYIQGYLIPYQILNPRKLSFWSSFTIGWFHKSIKADNIIFLSKTNSSHADAISHETYDIKHPYLIGFDCSRPSDAETWYTVDFNAENNIYRHPDRWGRPVRYERHHDMYALVNWQSLGWSPWFLILTLLQGTLLLEIGLWISIPTLDRKKKNFTWITPQKLFDFYLETACPRLAHAAGSRYAGAVETCLQRRNWDDCEDWKLQRIIRQQVLQPLCKSLWRLE